MGFTVRLRSDDFEAVVETDQAAYPDMLEEMIARCQKMFVETWTAWTADPPETPDA